MQAVGHSRTLGSSQARLLAPVQQLDNSFVAAVQNQGCAYGVLLTTPVTSQQPRPLLDAEQQLPLPSKLHSLHVLQPAGSHTGGRPGAGVAAVVLADGTVAAADFKQLRLQPAVNTPAAAAGATNGQQHRATLHHLSTASNGELLAVAKQQQQQGSLVTIDIYSTSSHNSSSTDDASLQQQQQEPGLQLCHSGSILAPSPGSKLSGLSVSGSLLVAAWSCHSITAYHHNFLLQGASSQSGHAATLQLPSPLAAVLAAAAAAGGAGEQTPNERSSKRKQRTAAAAAAAAGSPGPSWAAAALSDQHVLVLVVHNKSGSIQVRYALLDSTYGSCLTSGAFSAGAAAAAAHGAGGCLQLLPLPQHPFAPVALVVAGSVWLLGLRLPKADLAGLVAHLGLGSTQAHAAAGAGAADGSQLLLTSRQQLNLAAIAAAVSSPASQVQQQQQVPCILQQLQQPAASAAAAAGGDAIVTSAVQQLQQVLDKQKRPVQELQRAVQALCTALEQQQQQQQGAEDLQLKQQRLSQQQQAATVCVSQQMLAAAMSALAEVQEWALIERLHGLVSLQSLAGCADLVPALAAAQQYSSMRQVLLAAQEIPAESVVKTMQQLLQQQQDGSSTQQQAAAQQIRAAAEAVVAQAEAAAAAEHGDAADQLVKAARAAAVAVDRFTSRELLLHVLLFVQVDGVEAQAALRTLPAAAVLRLLRYSIKWLHKYSREQVTAHSSDPLLVMPSKAQVLEWSKLLLDAQLTKLMMMPAAGPLLQQLQQLMQAEVVCTSKLVALKGVTDTWMTGAPLPAAAVAAHSQYVLELLDLRVTPAAGAGAGGAAAVAGRKK